MKHNLFILSFLCAGWMMSCTPQTQECTQPTFGIKDQAFTDAQQRTVILNGLNHVVKDPAQKYVYKDDEALFKQFKSWGVNCVRFGIHWDRIEPAPGVINEEYLKDIDKRVYWAKQNNIYLIFDMHQDLYGREFDNGAAPWATLDEGLPHITGKVWSDAYLLSPAVQKSFDNFWLNKPAADGVGLQDHYANVWQHLANRYADSTSVIGFDVLNEPFPGTRAVAVFTKLMEGFATHLAQKGFNVSKESVLDLWIDEKKRMEALSILDNKQTFRQILENAAADVNAFEQNELSAFYQKMRDAIRKTPSKQIMFLEHSYFCNMGIESSFRVPQTENGQLDALCAYAPHAYDLVVDTDAATTPGYNRIDAIFESIQRSAQKRNLPVLIGEWGAFYMGNNFYEPAAHQIGNIQQMKAGHTYWAWWPQIEEQDYFHVNLHRPYPQCVNGTLNNYGFQPETKVFTCEWKETNGKAPSRIYLPNGLKVKKENIQLSPTTDYKILPVSAQDEAGYLEIEPCGAERKLKITL